MHPAVEPGASAEPVTPGAGPSERSERYSGWEAIGRGGSADVYKVWDEELQIALAIKLLRSTDGLKPADLRAMRNEVLVSRALRHPAICAIHDIYDGPRGFGIVMDYLEGCDLKVWMKQHGDCLLQTYRERFELLVKLSDALEIAHRRIVHRDLKPSNVFLCDGNIAEPLILDFGLSVLDDRIHLTRQGGTPRYMAPEQFDGTHTARSDLYALGIMAYELLSGGRHPYGGGTPARGDAGAGGHEIAHLSTYCPMASDALDRLVQQLIRPDPEQRPRDAGVLKSSLSQIELADAQAAAPTAGRRDLARIHVPAGSYHVGSPATTRYAAEKPMRRIALSEFWISPCPVTNADYRLYVAQTGQTPAPLADDPILGRDEHPVVMLNWSQASDYAAWAGGRLPTECEWEIAAKSGEKLCPFPWGKDDPTTQHGNMDMSVGSTTPVTAYPLGRNAWGVWDMSGNVWEWCTDTWCEGLYRSIHDDAEDPVGVDGEAPFRSVRGGSYDSVPTSCRCTFRHKADESMGRPDIGFRVVFDAPGAVASADWSAD